MELTTVAAPAMTRPADTTQYASGDLVANSTTAGSVVPLAFTLALSKGGYLKVRRLYIYKSGTGVTTAAFRLHLYTASPVPTNGDNGAYVTTQHATYLGFIDNTITLAFAAAAGTWAAATIGAELAAYVTKTQVLYGLLEARGTYTPASAEVFTVTLEAEVI